MRVTNSILHDDSELKKVRRKSRSFVYTNLPCLYYLSINLGLFLLFLHIVPSLRERVLGDSQC
jgi:hypothetical protein